MAGIPYQEMGSSLCVPAACFPLADAREGEEMEMVQSSPCQVH